MLTEDLGVEFLRVFGLKEIRLGFLIFGFCLQYTKIRLVTGMSGSSFCKILVVKFSVLYYVRWV